MNITYPMRLTRKHLIIMVALRLGVFAFAIVFFGVVLSLAAESNIVTAPLAWFISFAICAWVFTVTDTFWQRKGILTLYHKRYRSMYLSYPRTAGYYVARDVMSVAWPSVLTNLLVLMGGSAVILTVLQAESEFVVMIVVAAGLTGLLASALYLLSLLAGVFWSNDATALLVAFCLSMLSVNSFANSPQGVSLIVLVSVTGSAVLATVACFILVLRWLSRQGLIEIGK
ncbi:hypothetical protein KJY77_03170 [Canibacter sp. lx-72]|uniref:hypothetical protein n=1 Tax=Canibacter zhuwentaonis TaxID=2837491 RepID=UPI001BDD7661|nr:hypothetical protein [Canibacter zhuwentaonis]MBT1018139.1 hypothetical protein [Canibacter zhuwentaonis]MBT1035326.1 hypothetical protein [Canibacter zhuwentaonis]